MARNRQGALACDGRQEENGSSPARFDRRRLIDSVSIDSVSIDTSSIDAVPMDVRAIDAPSIDAPALGNPVIDAAAGQSMANDASHSAAATERFLKLFLENERHLYAFIVCILPSLADADDVLQETSLILWKKINEFQLGTDFLAWACRIAQFRVLQFYEKQGRSRLHFDGQALEAVAAEAIGMGPMLEARHQAQPFQAVSDGSYRGASMR